jgi:heavy metal sensor kinase
MTLTVRYRITLTLSLTLAALAAAYAVSLLYVARQRLISELDQKMELEAFLTADLIRLDPAAAPHRLGLRDIVEVEERYSLGHSFCLEVRKGATLIYRRTPQHEAYSLAEFAFNLDAPRISSQELKGRTIHLLQLKFQHLGTTWFVRVAEDVGESLVGMATLYQAALMSAAVVLPIAVLLSYWLAGRALEPLRRIANETSSMTVGNLEGRVAVPEARDEIAQLALGFNELLDRLQTAFTELRRFTADASHELRTPLTVIQAVGEFALRNRMTTEEYCDTIGHMLEEVGRLTQLAEALLMLARGEADAAPPERTEVELSEAIDAACAQLRPLADERKQTLQVHNAELSPVLTDAKLFKLALTNILHNAIKFTPDGGRIDVYVDSDHSAITIAVDDTGPGIPESEHDKVFARFFRSDRTRASAGRGFGLGLSLARSAIAKLGGTVSAGQAASGGARLTISIPNKSPAMSLIA